MKNANEPATKGGLDDLAMQIVRLLSPRFEAIEKRIDALDEKLEHLTSTLSGEMPQWLQERR